MTSSFAGKCLFWLTLVFTGLTGTLSATDFPDSPAIGGWTAGYNLPVISPAGLEIRPTFLPEDGFIKKPFMRKKIRAAWLNWFFWPLAGFVAISLFWFEIIQRKRFREYFLQWEMLGFLIYLTIIALTVFNSPRLTHADLETDHYQFSLWALVRSLLLVAVPAVVLFILNRVRKIKPARAAADSLLLFYWGYVYAASVYILARPMTEFV